MSGVPQAVGADDRFVQAVDDFDEINRLFRAKHWTDGLPIVPPTEARVARMLAATALAPDTLIARLAPAFGEATVERIAVNAVMAGCDPEYLPLLITVVHAVNEPQFNLQGIQATTNPVAVWILVNGPVARQLAINAGHNCLGEGAWANLTIGRALRLILRNIGGAIPGEMDRSTQGQPGRIAFCCAENEDDSPWTPWHVERGFARAAGTVTVIAAEGTINMNTHTKTAEELIRVTADTMIHPPSNEYCNGGEPFIIYGPEHANIFHAAGLDKAEVKRRLWAASKMPASRMAAKDLGRARGSRREELGEIGPDTLLPIAKRPEDIGLVVAGGPGTHSIYVPCFGNSRAVTLEVTGGLPA
jgi:hypothetical protein